MMWSAGILAAISSISYPAISAFVSTHADADQQGLVQVTSLSPMYHQDFKIRVCFGCIRITISFLLPDFKKINLMSLTL